MSNPAPLPLPAGVDASRVLHTLPDLLAFTTETGELLWIGGSFPEAMSWPVTELVGESVLELFAKRANRDQHLEAFAGILERPGFHDPITVTIRTKAGELREMELTVYNGLAESGVGCLVAVGRDVTDRDTEVERLRRRDSWASSLLRGALDLVMVTDREGRIAYVSPSVERILDLRADEVTGRLLSELVHPDDHLAPQDEGLHLDRVVGIGAGRRRNVRMRSGSDQWHRIWLERTANEDLGDRFLLVTGREERDEHDAANLLSEQTVVLERIARGAPVAEALRGVADLTMRRLGSGEIVFGHVDGSSLVTVSTSAVNDELLAVLDQTSISRPPLVAEQTPEASLRVSEAWDSVVAAASGGRFGRVWASDLSGASGPAGRMVLLRECEEDLTADEIEVLALAVDLASIAVERHHLQARLAHGALHDELTGLPNRRFLLDRLTETFAGEGVSAGLLFIDLDRFKLINDSLGHDAGDQLLQEVAYRFRAALRPADVVARVGGDEFVVLCPDLDGPDATIVLADRLTEALAAPVELPGGRVVVSASIGVVQAVGPLDPVLMLQDADLAMYDAKERGRNRTAVFHKGLRDKAIARLEVENALRDALRADEMALHYQPVVRLRDGVMVGVEALLRWDRPGIGMVWPSAFVPVATDTGLILPLGRWVIEQATLAAARWPTLEVAANLSARQLADADLVDFVAGCLARSEVAPERLCLEVTEADLVTDPDTVVEQLRRFKELGVRLAIDDFGTGFATLDYLRRFSTADILKVDASFVAGLTDPSKHDLAIVSAALVLADNLGFDTVAEGVETEAQRQVLERLGCELAQGHLFSTSVPADKIDSMLATGQVRAATPPG